MSHIGEEEKFTQALDGKLYGKIPFGRTKHKWENNIEMYQKKLGRESLYCTYVKDEISDGRL